MTRARSKPSISRLAALLKEAEGAFLKRFGDSVETSRRIPFVNGAGLIYRNPSFVVERANGMRSALRDMPLSYRIDAPAYLEKLWLACEKTEKETGKKVGGAIKAAELFVASKASPE